MVKNISLFISCSLLFACSTSKSIVVKKNPIAEKYANTITEKELSDHLYVITSDFYQGRETGKAGQKLTEEYLINSFKEDSVGPGNNGVYTQFFDLVEEFPSTGVLQVDDKEFYFGKNFYFFKSLANFYNYTSSASTIIDLDYGIESLEKIGSLENKIVLIKNYNPSNVSDKDNWNWRKKLALAESKNAKAVYFIEKDFDAQLSYLDHYINSSSMRLANRKSAINDGIPFYFISSEVYDAIKSCSKQVTINTKNRIENLESSNVLGFIEGSDPVLKDEIIVITAHYDHIGMDGTDVYNGADDDGSGTVALLEIAEAFQKAKLDGFGTKRSILIMPVSGEEKGLLGSEYYVTHPVYDLSSTVADFNIDMIGRLDSSHLNNSNYVYLIGSDKISKELHQISEAVNATYTNLELDYTFNKDNDPNRFYYRSDHYNFAKNNIPVIFYFNGVHEDYHQKTDTFEKIDCKKIEKISKLVFLTVWEVANRENRLKLDTK